MDVRFDGTNPANPAVWANGDTWIHQKKAWIDVVEAACDEVVKRLLRYRHRVVLLPRSRDGTEEPGG